MESQDHTKAFEHESALEELIQSRTAEGEYESSSSFTLDQLKARAKLGEFQLGGNGLWLLKIVQAAVAGGASEVRIVFKRRTTLVVFEAPTPWPVEEILHFVLSGTQPSNRAWQHLVTGLRACATSMSESLQWSCGDQSALFNSQGSQIATQAYSTKFVVQATRLSRKFPWRKVLIAPIGHLLRQTLEEWTAVVERCWPCPIPIIVDGRPLQTGYDAVPCGPKHGRVPKDRARLEFCLGWRPLFSTTSRPPLPDIAPPSDQEIELNPKVYSRGTFLRWTPSKNSPRGAVAVHTSYLAMPTMEFICDGVVIESRLIDSWFSDAPWYKRPLLTPRFMFAVEPDETDLSGFGARGLDTNELLTQATPELRELADMIEAQMVNYSRLHFQERALLNPGIQTFQERLAQQ